MTDGNIPVFESRAETLRSLQRLVDVAARDGRTSNELNTFLRNGNGNLKSICLAADRIGCYMVVQPPEETDGGWYSYGRNWYECLKQVCFHFWTRAEEDPELKWNLIVRTGINADDRFHVWLVKRSCAPKLDTFLRLCWFEGWRVDWRHRPKYLDLEPFK